MCFPKWRFSVALTLNRRFPELTGEDNLTVFLLQESEVPWMEVAAEKSRSATLWDLQAWTCYNLYLTTSWGNLLSNLHIPREQWVLDQHFWCLFCLLFTGIRHLPHVLTVPPTKACLLCATPASMDLYIYILVHTQRLLLTAVPWISEDHLLVLSSMAPMLYLGFFLPYKDIYIHLTQVKLWLNVTTLELLRPLAND